MIEFESLGIVECGVRVVAFDFAFSLVCNFRVVTSS